MPHLANISFLCRPQAAAFVSSCSHLLLFAPVKDFGNIIINGVSEAKDAW